jgi:hypothetical protein
MNIIVIDGLWGSGKAFVFKSIVSQVKCVAVPIQDGIFDLFSKAGNTRVRTDKIPTHDILLNYKNIISSSNFVFPSGKTQDETLKIDHNLDIDYERLFDQESFSLNEYIETAYPDLNATYVCLGNGACYNLNKFSVPNVNFILIHVDRSASTCLRNLLSRKPIEQSPATSVWGMRGFCWYFLRGYHALAVFKNYMLKNACDIHIKWGDLSTKKIYIFDQAVTFSKPNDIENRANIFLYLFSLIQFPTLFIRFIFRKL